MQMALGGIVGYLIGVAACLAAHWFAARQPVTHVTPLTTSRTQARQWVLSLLTRSALARQLGMALLGAYTGWRQLGTGVWVMALLFTGVLGTISLTDLSVRRIPDGLVLALLVVGAGQAVWVGRPKPLGLGLGLLVGGALFLLLALIGRGALGAGDVKLAAAIGAAVGFPLVLPALMVGMLSAGLAAAWLLATRRARRQDRMAYGPWLAVGAWLVWTWAFGLWPC